MYREEDIMTGDGYLSSALSDPQDNQAWAESAPDRKVRDLERKKR